MEYRVASAASAASSPSAAPTCLNCGAELPGPFCGQCGQSAATHRLTFASLLHELPHSIWHVNRGLPYTIKELFVRPGHTLRRYLAGQRVPFFSPISLILLLAGVVSFLLLSLHIQRVEPTGPVVTPAQQEAAAVNQLVFKYLAWFTIAMVPVYALLTWSLLRRLRYNLTEHLMANALIMGGVLVVQLALLPLLAGAEGTSWVRAVYYLVTFTGPLYQWWAFAQFGRGAYSLAGSTWRGFVVALVGLLLNSLLITLVGQWIFRLTH